MLQIIERGDPTPSLIYSRFCLNGVSFMSLNLFLTFSSLANILLSNSAELRLRGLTRTLDGNSARFRWLDFVMVDPPLLKELSLRGYLYIS